MKGSCACTGAAPMLRKAMPRMAALTTACAVSAMRPFLSRSLSMSMREKTMRSCVTKPALYRRSLGYSTLPTTDSSRSCPSRTICSEVIPGVAIEASASLDTPGATCLV